MMSAPRKVTGSHLQRLAVIYVCQSTLARVRFRRESTERQYTLADEAAKLGWDRDRIVVVDQDLGLSGRDAQKRERFKELVGRVCCGEVGAIFRLEVSSSSATNRQPVGASSATSSSGPRNFSQNPRTPRRCAGVIRDRVISPVSVCSRFAVICARF
jgi:hypothetical protein